MINDSYLIRGLQQIGIGVKNADESFYWYKKHLGADIKVIDKTGKSEIVSSHSAQKGWDRRTVMAINLQGGGGLEMWQHLSKESKSASADFLLGDIGINVCKIKCLDIEKAYYWYKDNGVEPSVINVNPNGQKNFFIKDLYGNNFQIVEYGNYFKDEKKVTGLMCGAIIGVSNIDKSMEFYVDILGYNEIEYDAEGKFDDFSVIEGGDKIFRRVLLSHSESREGGFGRLLGSSQIELVQVSNRKPEIIYKDRIVGDLGFFHLCFDVSGILALKNTLLNEGYSFSIVGQDKNKSHINLDNTVGTFSHTEDPDGTLIEFVETHKVPIIKSLNVRLNLNRRDPHKPIPSWIIKALKFNRSKK